MNSIKTQPFFRLLPLFFIALVLSLVIVACSGSESEEDVEVICEEAGVTDPKPRP